MLHYCADVQVIGTEFYVMEFLEGRAFSDVLMPELTPAKRKAVQAALFEVIGTLHAVDYEALGLGDFGKPANYVARQMTRWRAQYEAAKTEELPAMEKLMDWLGAHIPETEEHAISHGDFRLGNMMVAPNRPAIIAVLDWELATLATRWRTLPIAACPSICRAVMGGC